jgi:class 3 adenylate cyclase
LPKQRPQRKDAPPRLDGARLKPPPATKRLAPEVLQRLIEENLKDLGVNLIGQRLKLFDPVAALRADAAKGSAERRQVTVMFSELVGSTALAARMDPEALREVIFAYQNCVAAIVRRFDRFVARYMGDGVLVYFGYPRAHDGDAELAVRHRAGNGCTRITRFATDPCRHCDRTGRHR